MHSLSMAYFVLYGGGIGGGSMNGFRAEVKVLALLEPWKIFFWFGTNHKNIKTVSSERI
jgi:hypothetical protein